MTWAEEAEAFRQVPDAATVASSKPWWTKAVMRPSSP